MAEAGLKPHLSKGFKVSNDPMFEEKVADIVGLDLDQPERVVVLCVDEKSQLQALDRTQPGLPLKKGRAATMTHDCKRHGTTTLFAALDVISDVVIGECLPRHRAREFQKFLCRIDRAVLGQCDVRLVLDNYTTHKTPEVQAWLEKHPRFKLYFTPTSASWLNPTPGHVNMPCRAAGRTVLCRDHIKTHPAWQLHQRQRPRDSHL